MTDAQKAKKVGSVMSSAVAIEIGKGNMPELGFIGRGIVRALPASFWLKIVRFVLTIAGRMFPQFASVIDEILSLIDGFTNKVSTGEPADDTIGKALKENGL